MTTVIGAALYKAEKSSDRGRLRLLRCKLDGECEVLKQHGQCINAWTFLSSGCVYGRETKQETHTKRAMAYRKDYAALKEKKKGLPKMPDSAKRELAVVGEYVWIPYSHAAMCESVPFLGHSGGFRTGNPFVKVEDFTAAVVVKLANFRPRAMMGGEIRLYQKESVPLFLYHASKRFPELWAEALALDPRIETKVIKPVAYRNTPVSVTLLSPGTAISVDKWDAGARWDGEYLELSDQGARMVIGIFTRQFVGPVTLRFKPTREYKVLVRDDNELVRLFNEGKLGVVK